MFDKIKRALVGETVDYKALIAKGATIIDVRSPSEFMSGNANGSVNIPLQDLAKRIEEIKGDVVLTVCASGMRSASAKSVLKKHGFEVHNAGAWTNLNF